MSEDDNQGMTESEERIAKAVVRQLQQELRIGVGKTVLDHIWKAIVTLLFAAAIYGLANSPSLHAVAPPPHA